MLLTSDGDGDGVVLCAASRGITTLAALRLDTVLFIHITHHSTSSHNISQHKTIHHHLIQPFIISSQFPTLRSLDASLNHITAVDGNCFEKCSQIRDLQLYLNDITKIDGISWYD